jgi:hypothetical protein
MLPVLAFLANPAFWAGVSKVLPAVAGMMGKGESSGGQTQQPQQPPMQQQPQIPPQLMPSRPIPSYGENINAMLQKTRGF